MENSTGKTILCKAILFRKNQIQNRNLTVTKYFKAWNKHTNKQPNKQTNKALSRKQTLILHLLHKVSAMLLNCGNTVYFPYDWLRFHIWLAGCNSFSGCVKSIFHFILLFQKEDQEKTVQLWPMFSILQWGKRRRNPGKFKLVTPLTFTSS